MTAIKIAATVVLLALQAACLWQFYEGVACMAGRLNGKPPRKWCSACRWIFKGRAAGPAKGDGL